MENKEKSATEIAIDNMGYESMLRLWRNAPVGHYMFQGEVEDYYSTVMATKRNKLAEGEAVRASKNVGW